jgi:hypothetical protein
MRIGRHAILASVGTTLVSVCFVSGTTVAQEDADLIWATVDEAPNFDPGNSLWGVSTLPGGEAVIVGARGCCGKAWSWHSKDGQTWEFVEMPGVDDGQAMDVATLDDGVIAVGGRDSGTDAEFQSDGLVWMTDDPATWPEPIAIPYASLSDVAVSEDGLMVGGAAISEDGSRWTPAVWHSSDGRSWEQTLISDPGEHVGTMDLVRVPTGAWLAASYVSSEDGTDVGVWRSDDGTSWEPIDVPGGDDPMSLLLEATPDAVMALVNRADADGTTGGSVMRTVDGEEWTEVATTEHWLTAAATGPDGTLVFTTAPFDFETMIPKDMDPILLATTDGGLTWTTSAPPELEGAHINAATITPDGNVIAAGSVLGEDPGDIFGRLPTVWLGSPAP